MKLLITLFAVLLLCVSVAPCILNGATGMTCSRFQLPQEKDKKSPDMTLTIDKARKALLKLVNENPKKEIEKRATAEDVKLIINYITSKESKQSLLTGHEKKYDRLREVTFIGEWALIMNAATFYIVIPSPIHTIWVEGGFHKTKEGEWRASIKRVAVGYDK